MSNAIRTDAPIVFQYYEIRHCAEIAEDDSNEQGDVYSFTTEAEFDAFILAHSGPDARQIITFWTLYGRYDHTGGADFLAMAIGDFSTKEDAEKIRDAILAPMVYARNLIDDNTEEDSDNGAVVAGPERASEFLRQIVENSTI